METMMEACHVLYEAISICIETKERERHITVADRRQSVQDVVSQMNEPVRDALNTLFNEDGIALLNHFSVNEYWLLTLACTAAVSLEFEQLGGFEVMAAVDEQRDLVADQDLLRRVNSDWASLLDAELSLALTDGLIVKDETHPFLGDQEFVNPVFILN